MNIICNVTGSERKRLAQALGAILLAEPVYTKAPTFAYVLGDYSIDKIGTIVCPDSATPETVTEIIAKLTDEGFSPEISNEIFDGDAEGDSGTEETPDDTELSADSEDGEEAASDEEASAEIPAETPDVASEAEAEAQPEEAAMEADVGAETPDVAASEETIPSEIDQPVEKILDEKYTAETEVGSSEDDTKLTISIPCDKLTDDALARLRIMVSNKEELFKRALLADELPIVVTEDKVSFPWFTLTGVAGESMAYTQFITALCKMAAEQTRVLDKPYDGDNDRFAMRIFMVRLNMKGAEFALARRLMMKHLDGNSGWRYEASANRPEHRGMPNRAAVQHIKKAYPKDTRIELVPMNDETGAYIQIGTHGVIVGADDNGSLFIRLDSGSTFGIAFSTEQATNDEGVTAPGETPDSDVPFDSESADGVEAPASVEEANVPAEDAPADGDDAATEDVPVSDEYFRPDEDAPDAESDSEEE